MGETNYIQDEQEKREIDHLIFQEMEAEVCESWHGKRRDDEIWGSKQRELFKAERLNIAKKRNSGLERYATHSQVEV